MDDETEILAKKSLPLDGFDDLVKQHQASLKSFLYRFTTSTEDVEDIAQETFAKAFQKFDSFNRNSSFRTWLFAIATNLAKDQLRAQKRWQPIAQDKCKELIGSTPELATELHHINQTSAYGKYEIHEHIDFCFTCIMKTVPLEQQLSLMLADIYDFKITEIAEILQATPGVVKHYLHSARTTMRVIFEQRCALINKNGICHQCSELNGFNNTQAKTQRIIAEMELVKASQDPSKERLFFMRTHIVKAIDPLRANGTDLHNFLLNCTHKANGTA
ncbi:MAG TPA: sigma-70 family RNA polymerase sigma factor [Chitinophagaceae bacterium]